MYFFILSKKKKKQHLLVKEKPLLSWSMVMIFPHQNYQAKEPNLAHLIIVSSPEQGLQQSPHILLPKFNSFDIFSGYKESRKASFKDLCYTTYLYKFAPSYTISHHKTNLTIKLILFTLHCASQSYIISFPQFLEHHASLPSHTPK